MHMFQIHLYSFNGKQLNLRAVLDTRACLRLRSDFKTSRLDWLSLLLKPASAFIEDQRFFFVYSSSLRDLKIRSSSRVELTNSNHIHTDHYSCNSGSSIERSSLQVAIKTTASAIAKRCTNINPLYIHSLILDTAAFTAERSQIEIHLNGAASLQLFIEMAKPSIQLFIWTAKP